MAPKRNSPLPNMSGPTTSSTDTVSETSASRSPATSTRASALYPTSSKSSKHPQSPQDILFTVWQKYMRETPQRVKLLDIFMVFLVVVGGIQFLYVVLAGNYPFNAFLSGFSATVGQFVLTASLRIQTNPENRKDFEKISNERAFADFVFGSLLLHFFCVNFIN